jgi:hypothetical protein
MTNSNDTTTTGDSRHPLSTNGLRPAHLVAVLAVVVGVLAFLLISSPDPDPTASATSEGTTSTSELAVTTTVAPSTTAPYPTAMDGCTPNTDWTQVQADEWIQRMTSRKTYGGETDTTVSVEFKESVAGYNGPLCQPVPVSVDYWYVLFQGVPSSFSSTTYPFMYPGPRQEVTNMTMTYSDPARQTVQLDGRAKTAISPPRPATECEGILLAVYTGPEINESELPETINSESEHDPSTNSSRGVRHTLAFRRPVLHQGFTPPAKAC